MYYYKKVVTRFKKKLGLVKQPVNSFEKIITTQFFFNTDEQNTLLIFDDFLPNMLGSWRCAEIVAHLNKFAHSLLVCNIDLKKGVQSKDFEPNRQKFLTTYGHQINNGAVVSINHYPGKINVNARLAYCLFYNNLLKVYPLLTHYKIPFAFTLYPGGGFKLYNKACEIFLKEIKGSALFKGVFVTQQSVYDYLIERLNFNPATVKFIYGCPVEIENYSISPQKKYYKQNKQTLDICFVAAKYSETGLDKGFEIVCRAASYLSKKYSFIRFHIVGGFTAQDMVYPVDEANISFYGYQYFDWFKQFYIGIDLILSPVKTDVLGIGSFDGFPTAAVIEAGLFGAAIMTADPTGDNIYPAFADNEDFFYIQSNAYSVINKIEALIEDPAIIQKVAHAGNRKITSLFNREVQINTRTEFINSIIKEL